MNTIKRSDLRRIASEAVTADHYRSFWKRDRAQDKDSNKTRESFWLAVRCACWRQYSIRVVLFGPSHRLTQVAAERGSSAFQTAKSFRTEEKADAA